LFRYGQGIVDFDTEISDGAFDLGALWSVEEEPFCDGPHAKFGFDGTETASRKPYLEQANVIDGPTLQLTDVESLCAFRRFCDPNGQAWKQVGNTDEPKMRAHTEAPVATPPHGACW
jgi:hypothetical protein